MLKKKKILFYIFLIVIVASCVKKTIPTPVPEDGDCSNFSYSSSGPSSGTNLVNWPSIDTTYNTPCFNPNNSNEIIYVQGIVSNGSTRIVKRNLTTKAENIVISSVLRKPDWSSKDWITFNHADNQVWKIKSNGDSLTLLTVDLQGGHNPVWSPDGNRISFVKEVNSKRYNMIIDANGNPLDTIPYFAFYLGKWSQSGLLAALSLDHMNVTYANVNTHQISQPTNNTNSNNNIFIDGVTWTPDSQFLIWCTNQGIFKTNSATKETIKIKNACDSKYYTSLSVSPDGKKIIAGRVDQKLVSTNTINIKTGLSLMNIDGSNETNIEVR
jgi:Tol biopolymer transport system component